MNAPLTGMTPNKLRCIADMLDLFDQQLGAIAERAHEEYNPSGEMQADLRTWAGELETADAVLAVSA